MKIAYFDCPFGAAGDMLLGSLLDAGLATENWLAQLKLIALPTDSYRVKIENVKRSSIVSKKVSIIYPGSANNVSNTEQGEAPKQNILDREHFEQERSLSDISEIICRSQISVKAKELSAAIFERLAKSEGAVHGVEANQVHFHEVGAIDSIIDIIGFAIAYDLLGIEASFVSALPLGCGTIETRHGRFPVPGPATVALLAEAGAPISQEKYNHECLTPTGAAILTTIAKNWGSMPASDKFYSTGCGAGDREFESHPNICRVFILESKAMSEPPSRFNNESIVVLETNFDDFSPQMLAFTQEQLIELGALDVFVTPCVMKKGRSGHQLTVLCRPLEAQQLQQEILLNTSSLGVRRHTVERAVAKRDWITVKLEDDQAVRIKVARDNQGSIIHFQPEYEDCAASAVQLHMPLEEVVKEAIRQFKNLQDVQ